MHIIVEEIRRCQRLPGKAVPGLWDIPTKRTCFFTIFFFNLDFFNRFLWSSIEELQFLTMSVVKFTAKQRNSIYEIVLFNINIFLKTLETSTWYTLSLERKFIWQRHLKPIKNLINERKTVMRFLTVFGTWTHDA